MKKLVLSGMAAVAMLLTCSGNVQAQRLKTAGSTSILYEVPEDPIGKEGPLTPGETTGGWTVGQLNIYPNPIAGGYCYVQIGTTGIMNLKAIPLSGKFMGSDLPFVIDPYYTANTRKLVVLPSYLYAADYLITGYVGKTFIQQRVTIIR